jgi:hypothetical protein
MTEPKWNAKDWQAAARGVTVLRIPALEVKGT